MGHQLLVLQLRFWARLKGYVGLPNLVIAVWLYKRVHKRVLSEGEVLKGVLSLFR